MGTSTPPKMRAKIKPKAGAALPAPEPLDEGDLIEFGMTVEYKHPRKGSYWPKFGSHTRIRPGETAEEAKDRLVAFVMDEINAQIKALSE